MGSNQEFYQFISLLLISQIQTHLVFKMSADEVQNVASEKVEAPVKKTTVAKAKKSTGAKKGTKGEAKKMSYLEMVTDAITTMKDRSGSSRKAITRHILETHKIDAAKVIHIRKAIAHGMEKGILKQARTSGKGAGSFRVAKEEKPKKVTKPKKPVAKKVVKASSAGASTVKKNLQKKTVKKVAPKKVAKKAVAKTQEKTTKPTKKPSAPKKDEKPSKKQAGAAKTKTK